MALIASPAAVLAGLVIFTPAPALAGPAELKAVVEALPGKLKALYDKNEEGFAGSTMDMVEAHAAVEDGVMPDLIALETDGSSAAENKELQDQVEAELAGVGAGVYYQNHATGWGGTITKIEVAAARLAHLENRICHAVTKLYEEDESFDLPAWHEKWEKAGGAAGGEDREDEPVAEGLAIIGDTLVLARGSSGGSCAEPAEGLAEKQVGFSAKAGQKLVVAATGLRLRVLHVADDGVLAPFTEWGRCHDVRLPASKGGGYRIEFGKKETGDEKPAHLLVEIR